MQASSAVALLRSAFRPILTSHSSHKLLTVPLYTQSFRMVATTTPTTTATTTATTATTATTPSATTPSATTAATVPKPSRTPKNSKEDVEETDPSKRKKESITKTLIPGQIENFPFDNVKLAKHISSGEFKGKVHFFSLDFETTGTSTKQLPRILEIHMEHLPYDKAPTASTVPSLGDGLPNPTVTDSQFYSLLDPGIASSHHAYAYHGIDRSAVRDQQTLAEAFPNILTWLQKFSTNKEDAFVFLMPHFAKVEMLTLSNEFSRCNLVAPTNWGFVNATNILQQSNESSTTKALNTIYSELYGEEPSRFHRADADSKIVKACLTKVYPDPTKFKTVVLEEMSKEITKYI